MRPCQGRDRGFESRRDRLFRQLDDNNIKLFLFLNLLAELLECLKPRQKS